MNLPVNQFKRALGAGGTIFGAWLGSGAPATAEAMGCAGFDFVVVVGRAQEWLAKARSLPASAAPKA